MSAIYIWHLNNLEMFRNFWKCNEYYLQRLSTTGVEYTLKPKRFLTQHVKQVEAFIEEQRDTWTQCDYI